MWSKAYSDYVMETLCFGNLVEISAFFHWCRNICAFYVWNSSAMAAFWACVAQKSFVMVYLKWPQDGSISVNASSMISTFTQVMLRNTISCIEVEDHNEAAANMTFSCTCSCNEKDFCVHCPFVGRNDKMMQLLAALAIFKHLYNPHLLIFINKSARLLSYLGLFGSFILNYEIGTKFIYFDSCLFYKNQISFLISLRNEKDSIHLGHLWLQGFEVWNEHWSELYLLLVFDLRDKYFDFYFRGKWICPKWFLKRRRELILISKHFSQ